MHKETGRENAGKMAGGKTEKTVSRRYVLLHIMPYDEATLINTIPIGKVGKPVPSRQQASQPGQ